MSQLYLDIAKNDRIEVEEGRIVIMACKLRNEEAEEKVRVRIYVDKSIPIKLIKSSSVDDEPHMYLDISRNDRIEVEEGRVVIMAQKLRNCAYGDEKVRVRIHADKSIPIKLVKCSCVHEELHPEKEIEQGG